MKTLKMTVALLFVTLALGAQEGASPLAPDVPISTTPIEDVVLRYSRLEGGVPVRIVRHGLSGTTLRPNELALPRDDGSFVELYPFDWIHAVDRDVDLVATGNFLTLTTVRRNTHAVIIDATRVELAYGTIEWRRRSAEAPPFAVSAANILISGRGEGTIRRFGTAVSVAVRSGRFDIFDGERLVGILGAGQTREFALAASEDTASGEAIADLRSILDETLERSRSGDVDGELLMTVWNRTVPAIIRYGEAEARADAAVRHPDVVQRDIAEALRYLGGYQFTPPRHTGM